MERLQQFVDAADGRGERIVSSPDQLRRAVDRLPANGAERHVLYVRRADGKGHPTIVAADVRVPKWRAGSNELLFSVGDNLMSSIVSGEVDPDPSPPRLIAELPGLKAFDALPDTSEVVALVSDLEANRQTRIVVVQNWSSEVDAKLPSPR